MACATGIPLSEWRREFLRDERIIATAMSLLSTEDDAEPDGSQLKTSLSSAMLEAPGGQGLVNG